MKSRFVNWAVAAALTFGGLSLSAASSATVSLLYTYDGSEFRTDGKSAKAAFVVTSLSGASDFQVAGVNGTEIGAWNGRNQVFLVDGLAVSTEFTSCKVDGEAVDLVAPFRTTAAMATRSVGGKVYQSTISKGPAWWVSSDGKTLDYLPVDEGGADKQVTASSAGWSLFTDGDYDVFAWPEAVTCNGRRYIVFHYAVRAKDKASAPSVAKCAIGAKLQLNGNLKVKAGLSAYGWLVQQAGGLTPYMNLGLFTRNGRGGIVEKIDRLPSAMWFGAVETGKTLADHAFDNTPDPGSVGQLNPGHVAVSWQDLDLSSGDVQTMSVAFGNFDADEMEGDDGDPYVTYTAEGWKGTYDGQPHGISVTALGPAGAKVQYALAKDGPYRDAPYTFTNVNETPAEVWFRLEAEGYLAVTNSATVTVAFSANAWLDEPTVTGKVYDGTPATVTMGQPKFGAASVTYDDGQTVAPVAAGGHTAKFTVAATENYGALEKVVSYTIARAVFPGGGEEPGGGEVPEGGVSKFDTVAMYDGASHTIATNDLVAAFKAVTGGDVTVAYACGGAGAPVLPWMPVAPDFTNVCATSVWYKVASANYQDFTHEARVTVTPRDISTVTVEDIPDQQHTEAAIEPTVTVTDGDPTIVTADDYTVAYSDNIAIGTATVTLTGKGNYTGTKTVHFEIVGRGAAFLKAEIGWKLLAARRTFVAQLKVTCTSELAAGISDLRFMFADRVSGDETTAALWDTPNRAAKSTTMTVDDDTYRYVALDPVLITSENVPAAYGVSDLSAPAIPISERTIELYVRARVGSASGDAGIVEEDDLVGYVYWISGDKTFSIPVSVGSLSEFRAMLSALDDDDSSGSGTVKRPCACGGAGFLRERSIALWSAKADAGSVFAGWSAAPDAPECVTNHLQALSVNELRNKKLTFKVGAGERIVPTDVEATWARIDEDRIRSVVLTADRLEVDCKSHVTATVSGLPKGLKFTARTLEVAGTLKAKDAVYMVKVTVKNDSGYTWKGSFPMTVAGGAVTDVALAVDVVETGVPVMLECDGTLGKTSGTKVYVEGKKAALRATPARGSIFLGWYADEAFTTPATGLPKGYLVASQSIVVPAEDLNLHARFVQLEDWSVGTFDGILYGSDSNACGTVTFTVSSKGKVSGKMLSAGKTYAFNATFDDARTIDGSLVFVAHPTVKVDGEVRTLELLVGEGEIEGLGCAVIFFCDGEDRVPIAKAVQNGWKLQPMAFPTFPTGKKTLVFSAADGLTITFAAKGAVRAAGKVDGREVSCATQVLPVAWRGDETREMLAQICVYVPSKSGQPGFCKVYDVLLTVGADGKFEAVR